MSPTAIIPAPPTILICHSCPCDDGYAYPQSQHWIKAFAAAALPLGHIVDLPHYSHRVSPAKIEVSMRVDIVDGDGIYELVDEVDSHRDQLETDSIFRIPLERALGAVRGIVDQRPDWRRDIFVTVCCPHAAGARELEIATRLADEGHRLYALISCRSESISFGQALASSGAWELFRSSSIGQPVARLVAKAKRQID